MAVDFLAGLAARAAAYTIDEAAITRHCFRMLLAGMPARVTALPATLGLSAQTVEAAVVGLRARGAIVVDDGAVTVAGGLSQPPTSHRLVLGNAVRYVCCAVDAIGIPAALGGIARVESSCQLCAAPVGVGIEAGRMTSEPGSLVIWAADLDPTRSVRDYT